MTNSAPVPMTNTNRKPAAHAPIKIPVKEPIIHYRMPNQPNARRNQSRLDPSTAVQYALIGVYNKLLNPLKLPHLMSVVFTSTVCIVLSCCVLLADSFTLDPGQTWWPIPWWMVWLNICLSTNPGRTRILSTALYFLAFSRARYFSWQLCILLGIGILLGIKLGNWHFTRHKTLQSAFSPGNFNKLLGCTRHD